MKITFSDAHAFEREIFALANKEYHYEFEYLDFRVTSETAVQIVHCEILCSFVSDKLDRDCLKVLKEKGLKLIALRSAGFNHVDLGAAEDLGIEVCRVPGYSPHSIAEFALGLILALNRKIPKACARVRELNFSLDGLVGFDLFGKTVGVVGAGQIGKVFANIMAAIGCQVLISDPLRDPDLAAHSKIHYVSFEELCRLSDIISLHVPLTPETLHIVNHDSLLKMKPDVLVINTGRGALIDAVALVEALKERRIGGAALDVYEEEENVFFHDLSFRGIEDDILARLLTFPNVLVTSHQAFLTNEALRNIAETTLQSVCEFHSVGKVSGNKTVRVKRGGIS